MLLQLCVKLEMTCQAATGTTKADDKKRRYGQTLRDAKKELIKSKVNLGKSVK